MSKEIREYNLKDESGKVRGKSWLTKQEARIADRQVKEDTNGEWSWNYDPADAAVEEFLNNN